MIIWKKLDGAQSCTHLSPEQSEQLFESGRVVKVGNGDGQEEDDRGRVVPALDTLTQLSRQNFQLLIGALVKDHRIDDVANFPIHRLFGDDVIGVARIHQRRAEAHGSL